MQINRLFETIYLLLNKNTVTARELAEHFEVSPRTIYRDVEVLSSSGIPIYMTKGKGGGISLLSNFVLNKTVLTEEEKSHILSSLNALNAVCFEQTNSAVEKLSSLFGSVNADWVEVDFSGWSNASEESKMFDSLKFAIIEKWQIKFSYNGTSGSMVRVVEPLKLFFKGQSWYLYGYCTTRQDFRFFKIRRIKELSVLSEHFQRAMPGKMFDADKPFEDDFVELTLGISKEMAYRVYDEFPNYEILPNGDFVVKFSMPKGEWLFNYISTFGEHCKVLTPKEIRLEIVMKLEKTLAQYL